MSYTGLFTPSFVQDSSQAILTDCFALEDGEAETTFLRLSKDRICLTPFPLEEKMIDENISTSSSIPTCGIIPTQFEVSIFFDLKFEVIYTVEKDIFSEKKGIRLYTDKNRKVAIYSEDVSKIDRWCFEFNQLLNQVGFHEMFKPLVKLGKGNFASVYEVERKSDGRKFAVKAFSKQNSFSLKNGKESLINELSIMRMLPPHKNVLMLESVFESDNSIYVVLDLLSGSQLFHRISQSAFTKQQTKTFLHGLISGIQHLHKHRIMHRDIKPENIMLLNNTSMHPVIVDFGLSANADSQKHLFYRCGTPGYVAPQIIALEDNKHIEPQCDMFSIGSIFHLLLMRKALFEGSTYSEVYGKNKNMQFDLDAPAYKNVDPAAMDLMRMMLLSDPSARIKPSEALNHEYFTGIPKTRNSMIDCPQIERTISRQESTVEENNASGRPKRSKKRFFIF